MNTKSLVFSMKGMCGTIIVVPSDIQRPPKFSIHGLNMASKSRAAPWDVSLETMVSVSPLGKKSMEAQSCMDKRVQCVQVVKLYGQFRYGERDLLRPL